jgi:hypothetical protein
MLVNGEKQCISFNHRNLGLGGGDRIDPSGGYAIGALGARIPIRFPGIGLGPRNGLKSPAACVINQGLIGHQAGRMPAKRRSLLISASPAAIAT